MSELKEGSMAPEFSAETQSGKTVAAKDLRGTRYILYFYPRDMTPGCTVEACGFRDQHPDFKKAGVQVFGVSPDTVASHVKFATKHQLPFELLADPDHHIAEQFGVWVKKSFLGKKFMGVERSTFLIGANGRVEKIYRKVKVLGHVKEVLRQL